MLKALWARLRALVHPTVRGRAPVSDTGNWGEDCAADFLAKRGFKILERNARPDRRYEIDIIARDREGFRFVEVKTRKNERFGRPAASVMRSKRRHLRSAATHWLRQRGLLQKCHYQFDIVEVVGKRSEGNPTITHLEQIDMSETNVPFTRTSP